MQRHLSDVLSSCRNYDFIVNYNISVNDDLSQYLIDFYQDYVFFNWSSSDSIKKLDIIIFTYLTDQKFNEYVCNIYLKSDEILLVFEDLVKLYNNYECDKLKMINNTIWI